MSRVDSIKRETAIPNGMVIRVADAVLDRSGDLLRPLRKFNAELTSEVFPSAYGLRSERRS